MQIRPTAFTIGLIIHSFITLFFVYTEFGIGSDFPFYGIHQFRHLHTSLLIGTGIDPTTVSGILGYSQVSTTLNLYSHMLRENQIKACDAVANALSFTAKDNPETKNPHHANDTESYKKIG